VLINTVGQTYTWAAPGFLIQRGAIARDEKKIYIEHELTFPPVWAGAVKILGEVGVSRGMEFFLKIFEIYV